MRTTLDLPEELLQEAMKSTRIKTKTRVVIAALEELVRRSRVAGIKNYKGRVDLDIDLDAVRGRGCRF